MHKYVLNHLETAILSPPKGISHQQALHRNNWDMWLHIILFLPQANDVRLLILPVREKIHKINKDLRKVIIQIYSELLHYTTHN